MKNPIEKYRALSRPAKAALWFLLCGIVQKGISVIVTPIFTRLLSTSEYGQYTLFNSWLEILGVVITLRLSYGVFMQGLVRYDYNKDEYTSALMGLTTLLTLIAYAIYLPFRSFWNGLTGMNTFLMLCCITSAWAVAVFGFWATRQRVEYRYRALVAITLVVAVVTPVAGIAAIVSTEIMKVEARVGVVVAVELLAYSGMFVYYMAKGKSFFQPDFWKHALMFNVPLIPHYLSRSVLNQSDRIMINYFVGSSAAGIYGLAHSLSWIMNIVNQALANTLNPWIYGKIRSGDHESIATVSYLLIIIVALANLILIAFAPEAVSIFAPPAYHEAIWIVPPLSASVFLMFTYNLFADFEFYFERTRLVMIASLVGAATNILLNLVFIPMYGYLAAGYTTLFSYSVYVLMHYAFMRHVQREEMGGVRVYSVKKILGLCTLFISLAAILTVSYPFFLFRLLFVLCVAAVGVWKRDMLLSTIRDMRREKKVE